MYYKIQKDKSKEYFGTGPRVFVTLGPTPYSEGPVPSSGARSRGVPYRYYYKLLKHKRDFHWLLARVSVSNTMQFIMFSLFLIKCPSLFPSILKSLEYTRATSSLTSGLQISRKKYYKALGIFNLKKQEVQMQNQDLYSLRYQTKIFLLFVYVTVGMGKDKNRG